MNNFEQQLSEDRSGALVSFDEEKGEVVLSKHDELIKLKPEEALNLLPWLLERKFLIRKEILRQGSWDSDEGA